LETGLTMTKYLRFGFGIVAGVLLACGMAAGITSGWAQNTVLNPVVTVTTVTSPTAIQIIGTNASRKDFRICNAGTGIMWIWPGALSPALSAYELPALASGTTTCFTPPDASVGPGAAGQGNSWNAQGAGASGPVSFFEWD
jgi:hypothetical protein